MSGIAGVFHMDGQPAGPDPLAAVLARLAHRGPDGNTTWRDGPVALGFQAMHTTPEAVHERQPFVKGNLAIVFHGRLDNRADLRKSLSPAGNGDAELALLACDTWAEDAPGRLLGDFAFAFWDGHRRRLLCARDWIGTRPFAYTVLKRRLVFASEPGALFGDAGLLREPNEGMIGEFLADAITHREETVWKGVLRLPPSHVLVADEAGVRVKQYALHGLGPALRLKSDEEYGKRFREIFREAVLCRLRSNQPVCADLSGGLDSSSIVGMAQCLFKEGAAEGRGFETFSLAFTGLSCDESFYINEVAKQWGIQPNVVEFEEPDPAFYAASAGRSLDFPGCPNSGILLPIRPLAKRRGFRVVLSGLGSDEWLSGDPLRRGSLLHHVVKQILPRPAFEALARVAGRRGPPAWLPAEFSKRISLVDRLRARDRLRAPVPGAEAQRRFSRACSGFVQQILEIDERDASRLGLELRYPFEDVRLASFALSIPRSQLRRGTRTKFVLRRGLADLLPPAIRERTSKAEFSHLFALGLRALGGAEALRSPGITGRGWVNGDVAVAMGKAFLEAAPPGRPPEIRFMWPIWMIRAVEIWYNSVLGSGSKSRVPRGG